MQPTFDLDPSQQAIVDLVRGIFLVLAGPGSGKTATLSRRVARLIDRGVRPERILALTFTNKAAQEMTDRVKALVGQDLSGMWSGTFHSIAAKALRPVATALGYQERFGIMDEEDAEFLVKELSKTILPADCRAKPADILGLYSFCRNTNTSLGERMRLRHLEWVPFTHEIEQILRAYQQEKRRQNVMDFDDLLVNMLEALRRLDGFRAAMQDRFEFIMLDEAQDTNHLQWEILHLLTDKHRNLMVIGDLDQAIYGFRGADVHRFFEFLDRYPEAKRYDLDVNYRSNPPIVALANQSIAQNTSRFDRKGDPARFGGELPVISEYQDEDDEAESVAWHIKREHAYTHLDSVAVLYRAAHHSAKLQIHLARYGVPFVVKGGTPFFAKPHVKDVMTWLKAYQNPQDKTSWHRIITMFPGLGKATFDKIWSQIQDAPLSHYAEVKTKAKGWPRFCQTLERLTQAMETGDLTAAARELTSDEALEAILAQYPGDHDERMNDLFELTNIVKDYDSLDQLLEETALVEATQEERYGVNLGTVHGAKGLEYKHVYLIGLNEGRFPSARSANENLEEERRIFFVGMTRAIETLHMSFASVLHGYDFEPEIAEPSRFLTELPEHLVSWLPQPVTID